MRDYNIESDLKQEKFEVIKLVQGDKGNKLTINVLEDGKPVSLTGCSITAKYKRADGQVIDGSVTNISNNSFDAVIDSDITKVVGTLKMLFSIEKDDVKVSTFLLLADVREGLLENTGSSGGSTGGGEVTVDLSNYYKKNETYSKSQIDSQFKDIAKQIENVGNPTQEQINTAIDKAIEEGKITGSGGLNSTAKTLLQTILQNAIYSTDQSANINALMSALSSTESGGDTPTVKTYTITNNLTNCTNSNISTSVDENSSYTTTITANNGYTLTGATVTVTMGGNDITNAAYNNGSINITNVTGNIEITVGAILEGSDIQEIAPNYLESTYNCVTIKDVDSMKNEIQNKISFVAKNVADYWIDGCKCVLSVRDTGWTESQITIQYSSKTIEFENIKYGIITITKEDFDTAYQNYLEKISGGLIAYNSKILMGGTSSRFDSSKNIKVFNGEVNASVISNITSW